MLSSDEKPFIFPQASHVNQPGIERSQTPLSDDVEYDLEAQLSALGEIKPSKIMGDMKPSISELAKLYQERKSRIDRYVEWYSRQSMADKAWMGGLVASASFVVGSLLGSAWVITGLITGLYATAISIIEEHATLTRNRDAFTGEGAQKVEALIEGHIKSFKDLEGQIKTIVQSLSEQHAERAEKRSIYKDHVDNVGEYNQRYASVVELLENTSKKLLEHQEGVALTEIEIHNLYAEIQCSFERVNEFSLTLSDAVSSVEQEMTCDVVTESPNEKNRDALVDVVMAESKAVVDDWDQESDRMKQASKARKEAKAKRKASESQMSQDESGLGVLRL